MTTFLRRLRYLLQQRTIEAEMAEQIETPRRIAEERARANGESVAGLSGLGPAWRASRVDPVSA
jgi:hypothetical protein